MMNFCNEYLFIFANSADPDILAGYLLYVKESVCMYPECKVLGKKEKESIS